jgi:hypothetical protein
MKKLSDRMDAAMEVMDDERVRWLLGKKLTITREENVFGKQIAEARYDRILYNAAQAEFYRKLIADEIRDTPRSAVEIAKALNLEPSDVLRHLIAMRKWRSVEEAGTKDGYILFRAIKPAEETNKGKGV